MSSSRKRKSKKESYWREQVAEWRAGGLSQAEFCRLAGISVKSFGYWKRRVDQEADADGKPSLTIVPVPMTQPDRPAIPHRPIIIHADHGIRLEISGDFHPLILEKILRTLGHRT